LFRPALVPRAALHRRRRSAPARAGSDDRVVALTAWLAPTWCCWGCGRRGRPHARPMRCPCSRWGVRRSPRRWSCRVLGLLLLHLGGRESFGCSVFTEHVRYVGSAFIACGRDLLPRAGGCWAAIVSSLTEAVGDGPGRPSLMWSSTAPPVSFPCQRRSGNCQCSFNAQASSWWVHGGDFCGHSKIWSCTSVVAGGFLTGCPVIFVWCMVGICTVPP
jgi:hypothetical protein